MPRGIYQRTEEGRKNLSLAHEGKHLSEEAKRKISGSKNPNWMGDKVGYSALHKWVERHKPKPELCEECRKKPPIDLANISGKYKRDVNDFRWLCRKCHLESDGRINNIKDMQLHPYKRTDKIRKNASIRQKERYTLERETKTGRYK